MKLLIGVPTYGDYLRVNCANALMALAKALQTYGVEAEVSFISVARIEVARNWFASTVLNDQSYTHLLFVDSDVGFRPEAVLRMLQKDAPLTACTYPGRQLDLNRFAQEARRTEDVGKALAKALTWPPVGEMDGGKVEIVDSWLKVKQAPTGLMLIKREVFETLNRHFPELRVENLQHGGGVAFGPTLQCFTPFQREDGVLLGEDISFCRRWTDTGGEIHLLVDEPLSHAGVVTYQAGFIQALVD